MDFFKEPSPHGKTREPNLAVARTFALALALALALAFASVMALAPMPGAHVHASVATKEIEVDYQGLTIQIDGRTIITKDVLGNAVYPFVYGDRTYLPVRALSNALGFGVIWDELGNSVMVTSSGGAGPSFGTPVKLVQTELVVVEYADISVFIDAQRLALANEPFLFKDSVYLPVREIADALGCRVSYDDETCVVSIMTKAGGLALPAPAVPAGPAGQQSAPITASPPSPPETPSSDSQGAFSSSDLAFVVKGATVRLGQNISAVLGILGAPDIYEEAESRAYAGLDKFYSYGGIEVSTQPAKGDLICAIDVFDGTAKTARDIAVGGTLAQIEAAYGKDYTLEDGVLTYWAGAKWNTKTPQLYFWLEKNGNIERFGMSNGKSE